MENSNIRINSEETSPFELQDRTGGVSNYLEGQAEKESLLKEKFLRLLLPKSEGANDPPVPSTLQTQLIGRLFSPSQKQKKLTQPFRLLGMGKVEIFLEQREVAFLSPISVLKLFLHNLFFCTG